MIALTVHDPVCHMDITTESAAGSSVYDGQTFYFCDLGCKRDFDEDPTGILQAEANFNHSQPAHEHMSRPSEKKPWWQFWAR